MLDSEENFNIESNIFFNKIKGEKTIFLTEVLYSNKDEPTLRQNNMYDLFKIMTDTIINNRVTNKVKELATKTINLLSLPFNWVSDIIFSNVDSLEAILDFWYSKGFLYTEDLCFIAKRYENSSKEMIDARLYSRLEKIPFNFVFKDKKINLEKSSGVIVIDGNEYKIRDIINNWNLFKDNIDIISVSPAFSFWKNIIKSKELEEKVRHIPFEGFYDEKIKINDPKPCVLTHKNELFIPSFLNKKFKKNL